MHYAFNNKYKKLLKSIKFKLSRHNKFYPKRMQDLMSFNNSGKQFVNICYKKIKQYGFSFHILIYTYVYIKSFTFNSFSHIDIYISCEKWQ